MTTDSYAPFGLVIRIPDGDDRPPPGFRGPVEQFAERLADWLCALVPLVIAELRDASDEEIERARAEALKQITSHGDDLQFGGKHQGSSRTALARAFAILARADGGVTALGVHACTAPHDGCPGIRTPHPHTDRSEPSS